MADVNQLQASMREYRSTSSTSDNSEVFMDSEPREMSDNIKLERSDSYEDLEPCQFSRSLNLNSNSGSSSSTPSPSVADAGESKTITIEDEPGCVVCSDKATGYHYGVFTCEGCKGFFKRTVQKHLEYTCRGNQDCEINQFSRNRCQYCRFQKCVQGGMLKHAVRDDRTPGGRHRHASLQDHKLKKQKLIKSPQDGPQNGLSGTADSPDGCGAVLAEENDFLVTIHQLRHDVDVIPDSPKSPPQPPQTGDKLDVDQLMQYGYQELYQVIQWGKQVPGFRELSLEDQITLLKTSFMDLNVFRLAYRSISCDPESLMFAKDLIMNKQQCLGIGWSKDLTETTLEFCAKLRNLNLDINEFSCLSGLVLLSPDAPGVTNKEKVTELQTCVTSCLRDYETYRYPAKSNRLGKLLLCLPSLRAYSEKALENYVTLEFFGKLDMPPLVAELLE